MSPAPTVDGEYQRSASRFDDRVTPDSAPWPVQPGRYRLVINRACPWANRAVIARRVHGLEEAISLAVTDPIQERVDGEDQWAFTPDVGAPDGRDPVLGIHLLREAYLARDPGYTGGISVPALVDVSSGGVVTNDYQQLSLDLGSEWTALHRDGAPDLYPEAHRDEIDAVMGEVYEDVNNGVYRAGFAGRQDVYDEAVRVLFDRLDALEERLQGRRYLVGDTLTEADVRLFVTLARFDVAYHGQFKCNRRKLVEYPALWAYARDVFQTPGFGDTIAFDAIARHYYAVHDQLNPSRIVPVGPDPRLWETAHHRDQLGGRPFGEGTPPPPPPEDERV